MYNDKWVEQQANDYTIIIITHKCPTRDALFNFICTLNQAPSSMNSETYLIKFTIEL